MTQSSTRQGPSDRRIRLGHVGCGFVSQHIHLPNFSSLPQCELVALSELRPKLARAVADQYRIPRVYASHRELAADHDIEAVAVSAGHALQGEIAADLLAAGKHVFMEKPMAISVAQGERILTAERKGGGRLMIGYMKRYDPANVLMRDTVRAWHASGEKGRLLYLRNHGFCGNWTAGRDREVLITTDEPAPSAPPPKGPAWLPSDYLERYLKYLQQYTHNINLVRFLLDASGKRVSVRSVDLDEDGVTGLVVLDIAGARVAIESGRMKFHGWEEHTQVYFEGGWIQAQTPLLFANPGQPQIEIYEAGDQPVYRRPVPTPIAAWHYREEALHFLTAVRTGESFRSPGSDALIDIRLVEDIYRKHLGLTEPRGETR